MHHWLLFIVAFTCERCTRLVTNEECYVIFECFYCRACKLTIENDPEYDYFIKKWQVYELLDKFRQIET